MSIGYFHHYLKVFFYLVLCVTSHCYFSEPTWLFLPIFPNEPHIILFPVDFGDFDRNFIHKTSKRLPRRTDTFQYENFPCGNTDLTLKTHSAIFSIILLFLQ